MSTGRMRRARDLGAGLGKRVLQWARAPGLAAAMAPLAIALVFTPWIWACWVNYTHGLLYRDSPIFLYVAWCVRHGERLYDTVAMPDGPFACVIHLFLQVLGGANTDGAFRRADFALHAVGGAAIGALFVPSAASRPVTSRLVWAAVGCAFWLAALFHWGFTASSQRESYYALFTLLGFALWMASGDLDQRWSAIALVLGGFCVGLPAFGKQTNAVLALSALAGLALDRPSSGRSRAARVKLAAIGLAACALVMLGFVGLFGSFKGYWFWDFEYVRTYYQFHDRKPLFDVLRAMPKDVVAPALLGLVVGLLALSRNLLPARALGLVVGPALSLAAALLQRKGWNYHFIPAAALAEGFFLMVLVRVWHAPELLLGRQWSALAIGLTAIIGLRYFDTLLESYWLGNIQGHQDDAELLGARSAAAYIKNHTADDAKIFYYGHLVEIPLFAERRPATPYIVPWLFFGNLSALGSAQVTPEERQEIGAMRTKLVGDLCERLHARPPEVIAVSDPWCGDKDCIKELGTLCPDVPKALASDYEPAVSFDTHRVFIRRSP